MRSSKGNCNGVFDSLLLQLPAISGPLTESYQPKLAICMFSRTWHAGKFQPAAGLKVSVRVNRSVRVSVSKSLVLEVELIKLLILGWAELYFGDRDTKTVNTNQRAPHP